MIMRLSDRQLAVVRRWLATVRASLTPALLQRRRLTASRMRVYRAKRRRPYAPPAIVRVYQLCRRNHPPLGYLSKSGRIECRQCVLDRMRRHRLKRAA